MSPLPFLPQLDLIKKVVKIFARYKKPAMGVVENNLTTLTHDLGDALRRLKKKLQDTDMGSLETAYEGVPELIEVVVLKAIVAKKMDVETKDRDFLDVLRDIEKKSRSMGPIANEDLKEAMGWAQKLFTRPEVKKIINKELTAIEKPDAWYDVPGMLRTVTTSVKHLFNQLACVNDVLKKAKEEPVPPKKRAVKKKTSGVKKGTPKKKPSPKRKSPGSGNK